MKHLSFLAMLLLLTLAFSCGEKGEKYNNEKATGQSTTEEVKTDAAPAADAAATSGARNTMEDSRDVKGVGKFTTVELVAIDAKKAKEGEALFTQNCSACHKLDARFVGPALGGVTNRRSPEWILNMITNPELMIKEDPIAKALLKEYLAPMANQHITDDNAYKILEFFRQHDSK